MQAKSFSAKEMIMFCRSNVNEASFIMIVCFLFLISFIGDDHHRLTIAGTGRGQDPVPIVQVSKHEERINRIGLV